MNETLTRVLSSLSDPAAGPTIDDVDTLAQDYPFFVLPAVLLLKRQGSGLDHAVRQRLMSRIALNSPDPQAMFMLADVAYEEWAQFYPSATTSVTTNDAITKFLETYGRTDPREEALLERLIFNPAPDYSSILAREEENDLPEAPTAPAEAQEATTRPASSHPAPAPVHDTSLSESLAKIYIRQKRYDKAFEIIHTLSLNNPKKSAYFADQLRFLRKLMLNRDSANNRK